MANKDHLSERGRSLEDEYFYKKDQELIEKMRSSAAAEQARTQLGQTRAELGQTSGIADPVLLAELEALGFTPETVVLLPVLPAVQIAWAEGGVSAAERTLIVKFARSRGVEPGSAADHTLASWLDTRPDDRVFSGATRLVRAMLESPEVHDLTVDDLVAHSESIAAASGGFLGRNRISAEERQLLTALAAELKPR